MKSYIVKKTQRRPSLKRDKSLQSQDELRASSVAQRSSEYSQRKSLLGSKLRGYSKSMPKTNAVPYDYFVKELKIKLPSPKQKFYQFLKIAPFNRIQNQNELIALFLKNVKFFKLHQPSIIMNMARKVKLVNLSQIDQKMMVIVLQGVCRNNNEIYGAGELVNRSEMTSQDMKQLDASSCKLVAMNRHEYLSFLYTFINQEMVKFKEFINGIQTFKMFTQKTLLQFTENMTLHYYLKGEKLYRIGDEARTLFIVYSGMVSRKVIIQLQKINKIPPYARNQKGTIQYQKFERQVRILTKEYEHKIEFAVEDIVGVTQIIDNVSYRKEEIDVNEDTILLGIDRSIIEEHLDDYIMDRLKKYNLKKYPSSYDQLCDNYLKQKLSTRKAEQRKILAMQNELKLHHNDRRREKIEFIIKMYQNNIKNNQKANLKKLQLDFYVDKNK